MTSGNGPRINVLLDWLEDRLSVQEAREVERAVEEGDAELQRTVTWLRDFLNATGQHRLRPVPTIVGHRLQQHFRTWSAGADLPHLEGEGLTAAELVHDSRTDLARAAVRSGRGPAAAYQLAYTCEEGDVVLDVFPEVDGLVRIDGQVLTSSPTASFRAELTTSGGRVCSPDGDAHGRFVLADVPATLARLVLRNGGVAISLDVDLEAP